MIRHNNLLINVELMEINLEEEYEQEIQELESNYEAIMNCNIEDTFGTSEDNTCAVQYNNQVMRRLII